MNIRRFVFIPRVLFAAILGITLCSGCGGAGSGLAPEATSLGSGVNPLTPPSSPSAGPAISLSVSPQTLVAGQLTTLTWATSNAATISFAPALPEAEDRQLTLPTGSATFPLSGTTTYVATVADASGQQARASVTITVLPVQFSFSAEPDTIQPGSSATLSWTSQGISTLTIDQGIGNVTALLPNGSIKVAPGETTTYTATATDQGGVQITEQVVVSVAAPPIPQHPIKHIIFMLQENRTFDNYFGVLGAYRASKVPGADASDIDGFNPSVALKTKTGKLVKPYHYKTVCMEGLTFAWNESHTDMDLQSPDTFMDTDFSNASFLMDKFAQTVNSTTNDPNGTRQLGHYDQTDLPYYYELATQFATSDRFYSSVPSNTIPNRMYMFTGTSFGHTANATPSSGGWTQKTIFRALNDAGVSWRYYYQDSDIYLSDFADYYRADVKPKVYNISNWYSVLSSPTADDDLPQVVFIERAGSTGLDEHPDNNVQKGAASVQKIISALMNSSAWQSSVFILSYDEGGGLYDHVPPLQVPPPDDITPILKSADIKGLFNLSGFRVPIMVISPWVKPHFVSHRGRELTSILKLIETTFNVPPLTKRDAWADDMSEFFDFTQQPPWKTPPSLPTQTTNGVCDFTQEAGPIF
ncbi:MAG TPA: alkaline phosphatase family protein [Terriglobales bacterium]|nr:alkaline phosphatase family protein [Terriglobales bacterium]